MEPSLFDALKIAVEGGAALAGAMVGLRGIKAAIEGIARRQDATEATNKEQTRALVEHSAQDQAMHAAVKGEVAEVRTDVLLTKAEVARVGRAMDRLTEQFGRPTTSPGLVSPLDTPPPSPVQRLR